MFAAIYSEQAKCDMNPSTIAKTNEVKLKNVLIGPTCTNGLDSLQLLAKSFLFAKQLLVGIIGSSGKLIVKPNFFK